LKDIIRH
jgi:secreted Zn-dependent insulinase-like peptidase